MSKVYVSKISANDQLEIMKMAVTNKDVVSIRKMVRDGYTLSLPLLEMFYRFLGKDNLVSIVKDSCEDLQQKSDCKNFLREVLPPRSFDLLMSSNFDTVEKQKRNRVAENAKLVERRVDEAMENYGLTRTFYLKMCSSNDTFKGMLMKLGEDTVYNGTEKCQLSYTKSSKTYNGYYLRCFTYDFLYKKHIEAAVVWLKYNNSVKDYEKRVVEVANNGGLRTIISEGDAYMLSVIFSDAELREKAKNYGRLAYRKLYYHSPQGCFTLADWYSWYELDKLEALKRCHDCNVPRLWLVKHKHFFHALGLR